MAAISPQHPVVSFTARIEILGINPYVRVSVRRAAMVRPDWRKPLPVLVRVNGEPRKAPWRINMMPSGKGSFYLYLHGDVRRASHTQVGDRVRLEVQFDGAYRGGPMRMPSSFRAALTRSAKAMAAWKALTPSRQKEIVRYLSNLKSPEARARNVGRALAALSGRKARFMARSW